MSAMNECPLMWNQWNTNRPTALIYYVQVLRRSASQNLSDTISMASYASAAVYRGQQVHVRRVTNKSEVRLTRQDYVELVNVSLGIQFRCIFRRAVQPISLVQSTFESVHSHKCITVQSKIVTFGTASASHSSGVYQNSLHTIPGRWFI